MLDEYLNDFVGKNVYWIGKLETIVMKAFFHLNTYGNSIF